MFERSCTAPTSAGNVCKAEEILNGLANHPDGPFIVQLPMEPGKRERRWAHLFAGEPELQTESVDEKYMQPVVTTIDDNRMQAMETEIAKPHNELDDLKSAFESFKAHFE